MRLCDTQLNMEQTEQLPPAIMIAKWLPRFPQFRSSSSPRREVGGKSLNAVESASNTEIIVDPTETALCSGSLASSQSQINEIIGIILFEMSTLLRRISSDIGPCASSTPSSTIKSDTS